MNALVAGSGSYIVRLSVRDLHGPTVTKYFENAVNDFDARATSGDSRLQTRGKRDPL